MKRIIGLAMLFSLLLVWMNNCAGTAPYHVSETWCKIRHPVEALTSSPRSTCEEQHIIQKNAGGGDTENIILINTTEHDYLDRSGSKPWEKNRPWLIFWGNENLESAFMMGMYANGYHYQVRDYEKRNTATTLLKWDGASHAVYVSSSVFNFVAKALSYTAYQSRKNPLLLIDALIGIPIDFAELAIGIVYGTVGMIVGTLFNPLTTIKNLIPAIALIVESAFKGIINTFLGALSLVTWNSVSWIL